MLNKKAVLIVIAIFGLVLMSNIAMSARLDYPTSNRMCYGSELAPGIPVFFCFIEEYGTNMMEASFFSYEPMHDYYTPQLKELDVSGGQTQTLTASKNAKVQIQYGTLAVTGSPSYLYVKHR